MLHTVDDNVLVGPDAVETWEKENFATEQASIDRVFAKQKGTSPGLTQRDIITYFPLADFLTSANDNAVIRIFPDEPVTLFHSSSCVPSR